MGLMLCHKLSGEYWSAGIQQLGANYVLPVVWYELLACMCTGNSTAQGAPAARSQALLHDRGTTRLVV